ncbi:MAG: hypothetical protein R2862_11220 [Thermoanaerobaculia bacterium]
MTRAVARLASGWELAPRTTTASFFVLLFGFAASPKLLAGVGVVVALLAMIRIQLLPAALVLLPPSRRCPRPLAERRSGAWLARVQRPALAPAALAVLLASGGPPLRLGTT